MLLVVVVCVCVFVICMLFGAALRWPQRSIKSCTQVAIFPADVRGADVETHTYTDTHARARVQIAARVYVRACSHAYSVCCVSLRVLVCGTTEKPDSISFIFPLDERTNDGATHARTDRLATHISEGGGDASLDGDDILLVLHIVLAGTLSCAVRSFVRSSDGGVGELG